MRYFFIHLSNFILLAALMAFAAVLHQEFGLNQILSGIVIALPLWRMLGETMELIDAVRRVREIKALRKRDEKILDA